MNYKEIESYFFSDKKCEELLEKYEAQFLQVDMIGEKLSDGQVTTQEEIDAILGEATGLSMILNTVAELADTAKMREEGRLAFQKKLELGKKNEKIVQTQIDAEVSNEVQFLRRVRNIFVAYRDNAEKAVISCQSRKNKKVVSESKD